MKGKLHFILQVEISVWQQGEEARQVGGKLLPQISLDQVGDG
jgi:hypothetical protein